MNNDIFPEAKYKIGQRVSFQDFVYDNDLTYKAEGEGLIIGVTLSVTDGYSRINKHYYCYTIKRQEHDAILHIDEDNITELAD